MSIYVSIYLVKYLSVNLCTSPFNSYMCGSVINFLIILMSFAKCLIVNVASLCDITESPVISVLSRLYLSLCLSLALCFCLSL